MTLHDDLKTRCALAVLVFLGVSALAPPTVQAARSKNDHQFTLGGVIGLSKLTINPLSAAVSKEKFKEHYGVLARYKRRGQGGIFTGVDVSGSTGSGRLTLNAMLAPATAAQETYNTLRTTTFKTFWNADIQGRIGREFNTGIGSFSPYAAFGAAFISAKVQGERLSVSGGERRMIESTGGFNSTKTFIGWKASFGLDYDITEQIQLFVQGEYADYGEQSFGSVSPEVGDLNIELDSLGGRAGVLFKY